MTGEHDAKNVIEVSYNKLSVPKIQFGDLSQDTNEILIEHNGQVYRLIATKNGRLVLNK